MGSDPNRKPPFFFQKPTDAIQLVPPGETVDHPYPTLTKNYHYEVELVAALAKGGRNVAPDQALDLVYAYTVGLDMTRRDLQRAMGDEKKPWEIGKSFDRSAPLGLLQPVAKVGHFKDGAIWLKVNGQVKQNANLNQMIWSVAEQVSKLSEAFELMPGDIIYSGTPENVGSRRQGRRDGRAHRRFASASRCRQSGQRVVGIDCGLAGFMFAPRMAAMQLKARATPRWRASDLCDKSCCGTGVSARRGVYGPGRSGKIAGTRASAVLAAPNSLPFRER
jgi:2-keto-4-pentenoate hydratase/2-oxohepta-3-ene-1,7-dioic acid hydratase in catechol pathway